MLDNCIDIPVEYIEIIKEGSDFEIHVNKKSILEFGSRKLHWNEANKIQEELPDSLAIADDGGEVLIYLYG